MLRGWKFDRHYVRVHISPNLLLPSPLPAIIIPVLYYAYEPKIYTPSFSKTDAVWFPHQISSDIGAGNALLITCNTDKREEES